MTQSNIKKIKKLEIFISEGWKGIPDIENANVDVSVTLDTGEKFVLTVITPKNFLTIMENNDDMNFYDGLPMVVVKKLTYEIVFEALTTFLEEDDGYLFKLYVLAGYSIDDDGLFDYLLKQYKKMYSTSDD